MESDFKSRANEEPPRPSPNQIIFNYPWIERSVVTWPRSRTSEPSSLHSGKSRKVAQGKNDSETIPESHLNTFPLLHLNTEIELKRCKNYIIISL